MSAQKAGGRGKSAEAFRTISEVGAELDVAAHVLRFWESKFPQVKPMKRGGNRRYYRPEDVELLRTISQLLYRDGYTIKGVQKLFREQGVKSVMEQQVAGPESGAADATNGSGAAKLDADTLQNLVEELSLMRDELIAVREDHS